MSGGSLGYLYCKDPADLFEGYNRENLERAEALLLAQGYRDIAKDVRRLLEYTYAAENRIGVLFDDLRGRAARRGVVRVQRLREGHPAGKAGGIPERRGADVRYQYINHTRAEVLEAIDKQEPKKPVWQTVAGYPAEEAQELSCPRCACPVVSQFVRQLRPNYCQNCGQRLDWEGA